MELLDLLGRLVLLGMLAQLAQQDRLEPPEPQDLLAQQGEQPEPLLNSRRLLVKPHLVLVTRSDTLMFSRMVQNCLHLM